MREKNAKNRIKSENTFLTKFDDFDNFWPNYWPLLFDNFWKKIEKNNSKKWLKFFFKKSWQLQIFKNTPKPAESSADPQIWGVVTFGPRKFFVPRGFFFLPRFGFWGLFNVKIHEIFYPKQCSPRQKFLTMGGFLGVGQKFLTKKIIFSHLFSNHAKSFGRTIFSRGDR